MTDFIINGLVGTANLEPGTYQLYTTGNASEPWGGPIPGTTFTVAAPAAPATGGGTPGASAYDVAVANGFVGTQVQWLASLKGAPGDPGTNGTNGTNGTGSVSSDIMWGVNVHSGRGGVYSTLGGDSVMALAASTGFKVVRTDLYDASPGNQAILTAALASANKVGVAVVPILMADINPAITIYADETAAYNAGHAMGLTYGNNFKGQVATWEVGNEWNGKFGGYTEPGSIGANYNTINLVKVRGLARGIIDGLRAGDPACRIAFGSNSEIAAWGWLDFLWASGVRWDVTSIHFYSNNGNDDIQALALTTGVTDFLALMQSKYGVPNWITEFNYWPGNASESAKATYLSSIMGVFDGLSRAKLAGVFFYELLDEGADGSPENSFGIASGAGALQASGAAIKSYIAAHPGVTAPAAPDFTGAVQAAFAGDTVLNWLGGDVTLAAPIVLNVTQWKFAFGIRLNGAKVACSFTTDAAIHIVVPVVNGHVIQNVGMRNFTLSDGHFAGGYGGLRMECRTNGSWLGLGNIDNLTVDGHSGYAVECLGSVFEGEVSRLTTTNGLGAFHARVCGLVDPDPTNSDNDKGLPSALYITMPDFRDFTGDAILLDSATMYTEPFDLTVEGGYIVTGQGRAITAPAGLKAVNGTGIENVKGDSAIYCGYRGGSFRNVTLANAQPQAGSYPLVLAALDKGTVLLEDCSVQNEGSGTNVALAHIKGGGGKVYLNRSGPASGVTVDPGAATLTVAQYA